MDAFSEKSMAVYSAKRAIHVIKTTLAKRITATSKQCILILVIQLQIFLAPSSCWIKCAQREQTSKSEPSSKLERSRSRLQRALRKGSVNTV